MDTKKLRQKILDLAIHGKLVPQDPNDEPASVLLERIHAEKERLIAEGKIKRSKKSTTSDTPHYENVPFEVPESWYWCSVGDIVYDLKYGTSKKSSESGSVPVLRMGNLTRKGTISYDNLVFSSDSSDIEEYELTTGDLLFNRTNSSEWVGKTALYDGKVKSIYAGYLIRVRTIIINSEYLNIVMNSQYYRNWCYSVKTDAVNQSNINANKLASLLIPIPPISEQDQIVQEVTKMTEFIDLIEQGESDLQSIIGNVKSKILELAIHGKLVPQDANDEPASELLKRINPKAVASCDNPHYEDLPYGWTISSISVLCDLLSGRDLPITDCNEQEKGIPYLIGASNLRNGEFEFVRWTDNPQVVSDLNDLLISCKGTVGEIVVNHVGKLHIARQFMALRIKHSQVVTEDYLRIYILACLDSLKKKARGVIPGIAREDVLSIDILLPPKLEQKRITDKIKSLYNQLDTISNHIE